MKQAMTEKLEILKIFFNNKNKILTNSSNYIKYKSNSGRSIQKYSGIQGIPQ